MRNNEYIHSDLAVPPGEYLLEVVRERAMSQAELSIRMGRPAQAINEIVKGDKAITPETALQLERVLGVSARIWTSLEAEYQLTKARNEESAGIAAESGLLDDCPYAEMAKFGWLPRARGSDDKVRELRKFFGVASLRNLQDVSSYRPAFRKAGHQASPIGLAAWLRRSEFLAQQVETGEFSASRVRDSLTQLRKLTFEDPIGSVPRASERLAACGVALVILPHLPRTYVNGATFWLRPAGKAVVAMTLRGRWADIFWYSLLHELGHILLHDKRQTFLENGEPTSESLEHEANRFAANTLIPPRPYEEFVATGVLTAASIRKFGESIAIAPGIVVGRLQHEKRLAPNALNGLRPRWAFQPPERNLGN